MSPALAAQPASCQLPGDTPDRCKTTLSIDAAGTYRVTADYSGDTRYAAGHEHTMLLVK